jgi:hypothetical protein
VARFGVEKDSAEGLIRLVGSRIIKFGIRNPNHLPYKKRMMVAAKAAGKILPSPLIGL